MDVKGATMTKYYLIKVKCQKQTHKLVKASFKAIPGVESVKIMKIHKK